jgi:hypothetical protein
MTQMMQNDSMHGVRVVGDWGAPSAVLWPP